VTLDLVDTKPVVSINQTHTDGFLYKNLETSLLSHGINTKEESPRKKLDQIKPIALMTAPGSASVNTQA
jgi:hypothetical protein